MPACLVSLRPSDGCSSGKNILFSFLKAKKAGDHPRFLRTVQFPVIPAKATDGSSKSGIDDRRTRWVSDFAISSGAFASQGLLPGRHATSKFHCRISRESAAMSLTENLEPTC